MQWSRTNRNPSTAQLLEASQIVKDSKVEVPYEIRLSAQKSYEERKYVDGWVRDKIARGFRIPWASPDSHQHFTRQWGALLQNLCASAPQLRNYVASNRETAPIEDEFVVNLFTLIEKHQWPEEIQATNKMQAKVRL